MKSNIKLAGRIARATTGLICVAGGIALVYYQWLDSATLRSAIAVLAVLSGLFQLFEAVTGWCVMRAFGFRTPM